MVLVNFQCCLCGDSIDRDSQLDPCGVTIFSKVDKSEHDQKEHTFFCHYECFRNSMDSGIRIHLNLEDQR